MEGYWEKILNSQLEKARHEYVSRAAPRSLCAIGDKENAFRYLDKAYANHGEALTDIKTDTTLTCCTRIRATLLCSRRWVCHNDSPSSTGLPE